MCRKPDCLGYSACCKRGVKCMLDFINEKSKCTGCGACVSICPASCISFAYDDEGFAYPKTDSGCLDCRKCYDVCPVLDYSRLTETDFKQFCVAARHMDHSVWEKSSSGGAFSAICKAYCNDGDVIFGAKFEDLKVVHDCVYSPDEIGPFRKSKYVQSDLRDSYSKASSLLNSGRKVLFSGTPCQIAGLRNFLGREYDNLLCIDLICHGVGSPGVFREYIEYLQTRYVSKMASFSFRHQRARMGRFVDHMAKSEFENGTRIEDGSDLYYTGFLQCLFSRPSCGKCAFANLTRVGDITLGDFYNRYEVVPEAKGVENLSTVIVNTEKGKEVFGLLGYYMRVYPILTEDVVRAQARLREPPTMSERREEFFDDLSLGVPIEQALRKHVAIGHPPGPIRSLWLCLPDSLRAGIKRRLRWIGKSQL